MDVLDLILSLACLTAVVVAHGSHGTPPSTDQPHNVLKDKNQVHDQAHIMEHMDGIITKPEAEMTDQELQFHYFKMHDYDHNNMLDGIELISAITHYHKVEEDDPNHDSNPPPALPESQLTSMIDTILVDEDHNNDGYISYVEFIKAQRDDAAPPSTPMPTS